MLLTVTDPFMDENAKISIFDLAGTKPETVRSTPRPLSRTLRTPGNRAICHCQPFPSILICTAESSDRPRLVINVPGKHTTKMSRALFHRLNQVIISCHADGTIREWNTDTVSENESPLCPRTLARAHVRTAHARTHEQPGGGWRRVPGRANRRTHISVQ
jgi:hypothetical protein